MDHKVPPADSGWWSLAEAADRTGFHAETVRGWTRTGSPRVTSKIEAGRRLVLAPEVIERATQARPRRGRAREVTNAAPVTGETLDRLTTLDEVVRRQRIIDEHREEIERRHLEIARQYREIAELALAPSVVPDG